MKRNAQDLQRFSAADRVNHWLVGISFILLALSGLAFFHPAFFFLTHLLGGGVWARILHPFIGVFLALLFLIMFFRFVKNNLLTATDWQWLGRIGEMMGGDDRDMPPSDKFNAGQKMLFWLVTLCLILLTLSGVVMWRAYFSASFSIEMVRFAAVVHALAATAMMGLIIVHIYAAIWTRGTVGAMIYGTVSRAWARQHHLNWFKKINPEGKP